MIQGAVESVPIFVTSPVCHFDVTNCSVTSAERLVRENLIDLASDEQPVSTVTARRLRSCPFPRMPAAARCAAGGRGLTQGLDGCSATARSRCSLLRILQSTTLDR